MQRTYAYPKLVSVPTLLILLVAGVAGFILVSPVPAHAAGPTITLSSTTGTVSSSITIKGTGFANGNQITITTAVGSNTVYWQCGPDGYDDMPCSSASDGISDSLDNGAAQTIASAQGDFMTVVAVPDMPGGPQTVKVSDGTNSVTATFTVTPSVVLTNDNTGDAYSSGFPQQVTNVDTEVHGFGPSETVTINNNGLFSSFNPSLSTDVFGHAFAGPDAATLADTSGGTKQVTATGQTSALTAQSPLTIKPWVSFYNSAAGPTTFSFLDSISTSVLVEGHGFTAGTIAGNSVTVGGVVTSHQSVTVGSSGAFGAGDNNHLLVGISGGSLPLGQVNVVVQGTTFNLANGNINQWDGSGSSGPVLGGVLISSIAGTTGVGTGNGQLNAAGYGFGDSIQALGYGFVTGNLVTVDSTNLPEQYDGSFGPIVFATQAGTIQTLTADANGAIFAGSVDTFGDWVAGSYNVGFSQASGPATIVPASFTVHQVLTMNFDTAAINGINFQDSSLSFTVHGFGASLPITVTAGGKTLNSGGTTDGSGMVSSSITNPDLAGGSYTATATDGTNSQTDTFVTFPQASEGDLGSTLTVNSGSAGTVTLLRTGSGLPGDAFGVHGLLPNTAYDVNWGMTGTVGNQVLGSFVSTSTGGIPIPGVQITVPAGSAGLHLVTIVNHATGGDALFNLVSEGDFGNGQGGYSQYGDLVFRETITAIALPTVVNVGQTFSLSGSGLFGSTTYYTSITTNGDPDGDGAIGQLYSQFTTDSAGNIPASASLAFPALPALAADCSDATKYPELATSYYVHLSQGSQFPGGQDGQALIILSGSAATNSSSVAAGHSVSLTANGLCASQAYNVIFNYASNGITFTGQTVSAFVTNTVGSGGAIFTVPAAAAPGSYVVQLQRLSPTTALGVLNVPPTLTVTSGSTGSCNTTSCFTLSGSITKGTLGSLTGLQATFQNSANTPVTGIVYAVVHNSIGQTVYYTTATISPSAGGSSTAFLVLSGLPPGTYSVQVFATDTSGNAISVSTTTSVTLP